MNESHWDASGYVGHSGNIMTEINPVILDSEVGNANMTILLAGTSGNWWCPTSPVENRL